MELFRATQDFGSERLVAIDSMPRTKRILLAVLAAIVLGTAFLLACRLGTPLREATLKAPILSSLAVAPVSAPSALRDVSPDEAREINAALRIDGSPNPAARPFVMPLGNGESWLRALDCVTAAVYYEAASEGDDGMRAVAQVVLNRMRHPAFPSTVCGVVFQGSERATGCQFTFTCDGALARAPQATLWAQARRVSREALAGYVYAPVGWATHYHTDWVAPYWAPSLLKTAIVRTHIFYRWPQGWGRPSAFSQTYAGIEPSLQDLLRKQTELADAETEHPVETASPIARPVLTIGGMIAGGGTTAGGEASLDARGVPLAYTAPAAATSDQGRKAPAGNRWIIGGGPAEPYSPVAPAPAGEAPPAQAHAPARQPIAPTQP